MQSTNLKNFIIGSLAIIVLSSVWLASRANASYDLSTKTVLPALIEPDSSNTPSLQGAANDSWPQVQYDANRSGYVPQTVGPPYTELWRIGQYDDTDDRMPPISFRVQPIIAENLIFMPSNDGALYAFSTTNGQIVWSYITNGPLVNSAGYANGRVFVGSTDKAVHAVSASNGSYLWSYVTRGTVKTAPLLAMGKVFIGSSDGTMYALNQTDGTLMWQYDIGAPIYDTAAYDDGKIFFGGLDSMGYALNAETGELLWQIHVPGQGFRDRWTVAGNGKVFFTPMLATDHHRPLADGTFMFHDDADPLIYNKSWGVQKQHILQYLANNPYHQPLHVIDQNSGQASFTPPILYAAGGSMSPHPQPVLLPNGNANVIYRRSFGEASQFGQTTNDALYTGELDLATGDIIPVDRCNKGTGGWEDCGSYKSPLISDESVALMRSGNMIYLDGARGTVGLDTINQNSVALAVYNNSSGGIYGSASIVFYPGHEKGIYFPNYDDLLSEVASDTNDLKRPTPLVNDVFYIFHYNTLVAVRGTIQ